ncbi:hypothetical protein [Nonomuraea indica]|uniref:hypothetical protein n=1 Tax=Nonomuraea indica TaxID=1581193 RepID=UPI000C7BB5B6|nr:hypothetical protein [Nonomuraea indica]
MRSRYPIVRHRELRPFFRYGALRQRRRPLAAGRDEALVYRIGAQCTAGDVDAVTARRATAVSVVDLRPNVIVAVGRDVAAAGHVLDFPVTVTFACTVVDPVAVVHARHTEAVGDMEHFLAQDLVSLPDGVHPPGEGEELRRAVTAWLRPRAAEYWIPGVDVVFAGVDVGPAYMQEA